MGAKSYSVVVSAPGHNGEQLSVFFYEEYFTETLKFNQSVFLDEKAMARIQIDSEENEQIVLRIGSINTQFYLGKSLEYKVVFDTKKAIRPIRFNNDNWTPISFSDIDSTDVNIRMEELYGLHSQFFQDYYVEINRSLSQPNSHVKQEIKKAGKVDLVIEEADSLDWDLADLKGNLEKEYEARMSAAGFSSSKNKFLTTSAMYLKMELSSLLNRNDDFIYKTYLKSQTHPRNTEYVNAVKTYYSGVLEKLYTSDYRNYFNKYIYNLELDSALLIADSALVNHSENLEFELLAGIEKALDLPNISNRDVTMLLEVILRKGSPSNVQIAKNLRAQFQVGKTGYQIPECQLMNLSEESVYTTEWAEKIVYINFFTTWNLESSGYMELIKKLNSSYGRQIEFVSICMDTNWEDYRNFLIDHPSYSWKIYFGNSDKLIKEKLGVVTIPFNLLIGPDGKVILDHTPGPYDIENTLKKLLAK